MWWLTATIVVLCIGWVVLWYYLIYHLPTVVAQVSAAWDGPIILRLYEWTEDITLRVRDKRVFHVYADYFASDLELIKSIGIKEGDTHVANDLVMVDYRTKWGEGKWIVTVFYSVKDKVSPPQFNPSKLV